MKPLLSFDSSILDNSKSFDDPFFKRFTLRHAPSPLQLTDTVSKNYRFPTFYSNVTCAIGIFHCDYQKAKRIMPHSKIVPVKMTMGRALVAFSCYQYRNVMGVPPYNEIAMTIPVLANPKIDLPILPMIAGNLFKSSGYYVFGMPVTSKENQIRGNKIWGLPKVTQEIDIFEKDDHCVTVAKEEVGQTYFELKVPTKGNISSFDVGTYLYSRLNDKILKSPTYFKADFAINKHMDLLFKKGKSPSEDFLKIGTSPSAKILNELDIERHPFQFRYTHSMNSAFDLALTDFSL